MINRSGLLLSTLQYTPEFQLKVKRHGMFVWHTPLIYSPKKVRNANWIIIMSFCRQVCKLKVAVLSKLRYPFNSISTAQAKF